MGQVSGVQSQSAVSQSQSTADQLRKRQKAPKGTVSVQVFKGRLRLCWSYLGKRYFLYLGLPDGKTNRIAAKGKAKQIEDLYRALVDRVTIRDGLVEQVVLKV